MADIFISYASEDRSRVEPLVKALEEQGWSVFWDTKIPVGKTWRQAITEELKTAKCAVVIWSSISINSEFVHEEAEEAQERKIFIPVMIDKVKPPLGFRRMQAARLMKWIGETNHPEFEKLQKGIEAVLRSSPSDQIKVLDSKSESTVPSKPKLNESIIIGQRTKNALKYVVFAGFVVAVLLIAGIWWLISKPQKVITNNIGMKYALIQAGSFTMGSQLRPEEIADRYGGYANSFLDEQPLHPVKITKPFYLQITEVSQGQWKRVMGNNPSHFKDCGDDCPVEQISWNDAQIFINKLNQLEGTNKYRLPTEAEWEYVCRAGTETAYSFGDDVAKLGEYAWYSGWQTHHVGKKKPNAWGLYDMHGNVWELCHDWYGDYTLYPVNDPKGPGKGESRVLRGGSWLNGARTLRSSSRGKFGPGGRDNNVGFRVARDF